MSKEREKMAVSHVLLNLGLWSGKKEKEAASMETLHPLKALYVVSLSNH